MENDVSEDIKAPATCSASTLAEVESRKKNAITAENDGLAGHLWEIREIRAQLGSEVKYVRLCQALKSLLQLPLLSTLSETKLQRYMRVSIPQDVCRELKPRAIYL